MYMQMTEAIERADEALSVMLRLARNGEASCEALRLGLQATKALKGKLDAFQADSAMQLAAREHRGAGASRRQRCWSAGNSDRALA